MRYRLIWLFTVFVCTCAPAQNLQTVEGLELARIDHQRKAMLVLGGWAIGNIGAGLLLRAGRSGEDRRFHEMNALWNVVNLGIAGLGYYSAVRADAASLDAFASFRENGGFQQILLFNAGLDVGYILGGLYLRERANRPDGDGDLLRGYGTSVMLQGGFLLLFDLVNYYIAGSRDGAYRPLLGIAGEGLGLNLTF